MGALRWMGAATAVGAGLMYFADPANGRRRRARAVDELEHAVHLSLHGLNLASRDLSHRAHGVVARARGGYVEQPDDDVLAARVRAKMGHVCSHPHAVSVRCQQGSVALEGAVLEAEAARVVQGIREVPGVDDVRDRLARHATADIAALQGPTRRRRTPRLLSAYWPPATRLLAGGAGAIVAVLGVRRGGPAGAIGALLGGAAIVRGLTNGPVGGIVGFEQQRRGVEMQKTITIGAPVAEVFAFFTDFENFPRFMRHVLEVQNVGENRYHWKVQGPAGTRFEWDGVVMQVDPDEFVSWMSVESALVEHGGSARFEPAVGGGTRISIRMHYTPPLGLVGHGLARLLGADPKRELDEDLLRLKSLLEEGKATGHAGTVAREDLRARGGLARVASGQAASHERRSPSPPSSRT